MRTQTIPWCVLCLLWASAALSGASDWPQWRGPDRTDVSSETGLLKSWPSGGPNRVWLFENAGQGYSGFAVVQGKLFTLGTRDGNEVVLALDATTGRELWHTVMGSILGNGWGDGPRGTPAVNDGHVYAMSGPGDLVCVRIADGTQVWKRRMKDLGGDTPDWGYTESVLVDGNQVICTPGGGQGALAALNKKTGEVIWRSTRFTDGAQYASPIVAVHGGVRQYIQLTMRRLVGVSAKDGSLLWESPWPGSTAVIPTPIFHDGFVYVTSGYGAGCKLIQLEPNHGVRDVYDNKVMKNHHGGVILVGDHLYGYSDGPGWICQDFKSGREVWSSKQLGKGAVAYADGMLYCLDEATGDVTLVEASPEGWNEKGRFRLEPQTKIRNPSGRIWTHPVITNGKLYLRDQDLVFCYDVKG